METFIEDIYKYAFIIEGLKSYISLSDMGQFSHARRIYNETAANLESALSQLAVSDPGTATKLQRCALEIKENYDDTCLAKGLVKNRLLPELYSYISLFTTINVSDGRYTLKSSDSGFLTIFDNDLNIHLHDTYDPMYEAGQTARSLYKPENETFLILGCGLGYLAYQIYRQSFGSAKICIYEDDQKILDYAFLYGVLSLIPEDILEISINNDKNIVALEFIEKLQSTDNCGFSISPWKKAAYKGLCHNEIIRLSTNQSFDLESADLTAVNLRKNRKLEHIDFNNVIPMFEYDEWVVISAGPSLDDCISFLKANKGQKGLIAVNTVLRRLLKEGIIPDIIAAADQFNDLSDHITGIETATKDILLIADWLLNWKYSSSYLGQICFVRTNASAKITQSFLGDGSIWDISGTVASLAVEAAVHLGAKRIYLVGQDLAYPSGQKYAKGMPHSEAPNAQWDMQVPAVDGKMVDTCEAFDWFRKALEYQIAKYSDTEFINLSKHGAVIKGSINA